MTLLHPLMVAWISGAAVPLVLHLLSRSQFRAIDWGAMMFLTGTVAGQQRTARFKQWTLLLLRMGIVGLMAVALARPVIGSQFAHVPTGGLTTGGTTAAVIILDDSASMGYTTNGKSRLDAAREVTLQILSALKRGDQAALILAGNRDESPPALPSPDLQSIAEKVVNLQPKNGQADFAAALNQAQDLLEHTGPNNRDIYLIADRQAVSWRSITDGFKKRWTARRSGGTPPQVTVIPVGGDESDNVAIDEIDWADLPVRNQLIDLQVHIHNYGTTPRSAVPLTVWAGTRTLDETTVAIAAHSVRTVTLPVRFTEAGSRVISAAVRSTGLASDDRLDVAMDVIDPLQVLIVVNDSGSPTSRPETESAAGLMRLALAPFDAVGQRGDDLTVVTTMEHRAWSADFLKKFNVVILDDVPNILPDQARDLEQFANTGGGVLISPGNAVNGDAYNAVSFRAGAGLLPAALQAPLRLAHPAFINSATLDRQYPPSRLLAGRTELLSTVGFNGFFRAIPHGSNTKTLAKFSTGDPFLVESIVGRGRVLLMTSPVDAAWNTLSQSSLFLPLMQSIVRELAAGQAVDRNLRLGQPMVVNTNEWVEDRSATVQFLPGGQRQPATITRFSDHSEIRYARIDILGNYRLRYRIAGKETVLNFVARPGPSHAESDLTPLTEEQWKTLSDRVGFERVDLAKTTVASAVDRARGGREIWIDLLCGVLVLMMGDLILSDGRPRKVH